MLKYEVLGAPSSRSPIAVKLRASHAGVGALAVTVAAGTDGGLVVLAGGGIVVVVDGLALPLGNVATAPFAGTPAVEAGSALAVGVAAHAAKAIAVAIAATPTMAALVTFLFEINSCTVANSPGNSLLDTPEDVRAGAHGCRRRRRVSVGCATEPRTVRRGPHQRARSRLLHVPTRFVLEAVMMPAQQREVVVCRQAAAGVIDGVVDVARRRRHAAARRPTRAVPCADPPRQRRTGDASTRIRFDRRTALCAGSVADLLEAPSEIVAIPGARQHADPVQFTIRAVDADPPAHVVTSD
jgi:hypothetical protein